jgi:hypothetical protein
MKAELWNLYLFALAIGKAAGMTLLGPGILSVVVIEQWPYVYRWARYLGMPVLGGIRKGQRCKVLVRGKRNSCLIEFPDGFQTVTSRNALRKAQ